MPDHATTTPTPATAAAHRDRLAALVACAHRLAEQKDRSDIEVLAITRVKPGRLYGPISSAPGLTFTVEFTYTTSRRQRRTAEVTWAAATSRDTDHRIERFPSMPPAMWTYLSTNLPLAGTTLR